VPDLLVLEAVVFGYLAAIERAEDAGGIVDLV
jgi:hypothetical protein